MKPALLVIDVQKEFFNFSAETARSLKDAVEYINTAIELFREKDLPVICVQHMEKEDGLMPGSEGFDLPDELNVLPSDVHIHKTFGSAFVKTDLKARLDEQGVDTLILTGFCAEYCVLSTCRGAEDLEFTPIILRGSLASPTAEHIKFVENINNIISLNALKKVLN
jgi:nicotinamidase-related amidase